MLKPWTTTATTFIRVSLDAKPVKVLACTASAPPASPARRSRPPLPSRPDWAQRRCEHHHAANERTSEAHAAGELLHLFFVPATLHSFHCPEPRHDLALQKLDKHAAAAASGRGGGGAEWR